MGDLDQLLADVERVIEDEGVETFMDEGPDLLESLAEAVRELRVEAARLTRDLVDLNAAHASVCDEVVQLRDERDADAANLASVTAERDALTAEFADVRRRWMEADRG